MKSSPIWCPAPRGGIAHEVGRGDVFGKATTSRMDSIPSVRATIRSRPTAKPAVGRRAVGEGLQEEAELLPLLLLAEPEELEDLLLDVLTVDPDRPRAELPAVQDQVVGPAVQLRPDRRHVPVRGAVKGWCEETQRRATSGLLVPLEHGEVGHPEEVPGSLLRMLLEIIPSFARCRRSAPRPAT